MTAVTAWTLSAIWVGDWALARRHISAMRASVCPWHRARAARLTNYLAAKSFRVVRRSDVAA